VGMELAGPTICDGDPTPAGGTPLGGVGLVSLASHIPSVPACAKWCAPGYTFRSKPQPKAIAIMFDSSSSSVRLLDGWAMTYKVVRTSMQQREVPAQRVDTFWVVLSASGPPLPLKVALPDGREAMALFSGEDEASMFCFLREEANPHFRETSLGGVISLLYCPLTAARHVALDPLPGILGTKLSGLITLERERFARSFAGIGSQGFFGAPRCPAELSASYLEAGPSR
jgi:hypothetical protein